MEQNSEKFYELKRMMNILRAKKGYHTELISLYIPYNKRLSEITSHLKKEVSGSRNIKLKSTRKNVQASITTLLGTIKTL